MMWAHVVKPGFLGVSTLCQGLGTCCVSRPGFLCAPFLCVSGSGMLVAPPVYRVSGCLVWGSWAACGLVCTTMVPVPSVCEHLYVLWRGPL